MMAADDARQAAQFW
jgi:hypothetical protein